MNQKKDSALSLHFGAKHWSVLLYTILLYFVTAIITGTVQITAPGLAELRQWDYAALMGLNSVGGLANLMISMTIQVFGPASHPSVNRVMPPWLLPSAPCPSWWWAWCTTPAVLTAWSAGSSPVCW